MWNVVADLEQARDAFVPQVVEAQILDPEKLRCPCKGSADRVGGVGEDLARVFGHCLDDRQRRIGQVAPDVVANLLAGVLHVAHQDPFALLVEVRPFDPGDLFLPPGREDREGDDAMHGDGGGAADRAVEEMRHQLIELVQRRPPVAVAALLGQAQLLRDDHRIAHRALVQGIVPGRAGHGEDRAQMRQVVRHGLRRDTRIQLLLGEGHDVGAVDLGAELVRDVELLDAFQHLRLGPTDCLRAVFHIFVDCVAEGHFAAAGLSDGQVFEGAGLCEVLLALLDPGRGGRAQLEGPVLAQDGFSSPPNGDLGEPGGSAVFALSLDDGTHGVTTFGPSYNICCKSYPKWARFTTNETRTGLRTER